jgi:hypothetical protein
VNSADVEEIGCALETSQGSVAAPGPLAGIGALLGAYRVERDVSVHFHQVRLLDDVL